MAVHCSLRNLSLTTLFGCLMNKTTKWSSSINLANDRTSGKSFPLEILGTLHRSLRRQTFQSKATNADNSAPTPKSRLLPIQFPPCPSLDQINHLSATSRHPTANKQPNCPCSTVKADWPHFITVKMIRVISESFNVPPSPPLMPLQPLNLTKTRLSLIIHCHRERAWSSFPVTTSNLRPLKRRIAINFTRHLMSYFAVPCSIPFLVRGDLMVATRGVTFKLITGLFSCCVTDK